MAGSCSEPDDIAGQPPLEASRRALPGRIVDLIRDGAPDDAIRSRGHDPAVWSALVSSAMSAANRGWTAPDFVALVLDPRSRLGAQSSLKKGKTRGRAQTAKLVHKAWESAEQNIQRSPAWTTSGLREAAHERQLQSAQRLAQEHLTRAEELVMRHVAQRLAETDSLQRAIARQDFIDGTGLGKTAVETAQRRLMSRGLLVQVEKGAPGGPKAGRRRAHVWALPDGYEPVPAESPVAHECASNTGNRYVAPAPIEGATTGGSTSAAAPGALGEVSIEVAVEALLRLLQMTSRVPDGEGTLLLSWPCADERELL